MMDTLPSHADVEIEERTTPFRGYFRIDRYVLRHKLFSGGWSQPISREIFERGHAVGVLLYDPDTDQVGMIEQFRTGALAAGWEPWLLEIVAGIIEPGEDPEQVARREAEEEAGLTIDGLLPMCRYLVTPGGSTETMQLFLARIDAGRLDGIHGLADEGEDIRPFAMPAEQAFAAVQSGRIANSMTMIALQWLQIHKERVRAAWR